MKYLIMLSVLVSCSLPPVIRPISKHRRKINVMDKVIKCADKFINMGVDAEIAFTQCKSVYGVKR